jgi:HAD superfamily phosphoserine phosphatase-like hydrolase
MRLVIFDIDSTLVLGPTTERRFYLYLLRAGKLGPWQMAAYLFGLFLWLPRYGRDVLQKNKAYLTGLDEAEISRLAVCWAESKLSSAWFRPALERLRQHQAAGDHVILMSGTPAFIAVAIGAQLGIQYTIGSHCAVAAGRFTFQPLQQHPCGIEKLRLAEALAQANGFSRRQIVAYADSAHDAALLDWVGQPVAVRPDDRLAAIAAANGWEMLGRRNLAC